ncbi:MAG: hypothetical protein IJJ23_09225 [Clostridia bacterium]|nr:hypothetical protein [Clostridia bacterium]
MLWKECIEASVVLSEERIGHIQERHPGAYEKYGLYITQTVEQPDYIIEDKKHHNTAIFIRYVKETNLNVIVKLAICGNTERIKSSVITVFPMNAKRLRRLLNKSLVLYKAPII